MNNIYKACSNLVIFETRIHCSPSFEPFGMQNKEDPANTGNLPRKSLASSLMSLVGDSDSPSARIVRSREIDAYLAAEKKKYEKFLQEPKVLILGSSDSGKSTLLKQLKIMHKGGFSAEEKECSKRGIIKNIIHALSVLSNFCDDEATREEFATIRKVDEEWNEQIDELTEVQKDMLREIWKVPSVKKALHNEDHKLPDTTS